MSKKDVDSLFQGKTVLVQDVKKPYYEKNTDSFCGF